MQKNNSRRFLELQVLCRGHAGKSRILHSLAAFYEKSGQQELLRELPVETTASGERVVDLIQLYEEVVEKGGYVQVTRLKLWQRIATKMKLLAGPFRTQMLYKK